MERACAIVVGARCAGSAAAISLAQAGKRVIVLDRARFPSDTLSTHLMFAGGVVELKRLGALDRVLALGAPKLPEALSAWNGYETRATYTPIDGIDYGMCVKRTGLDAALVETAREAGAEVRERCAVSGLIWDDKRVAGVRYRDHEGEEREIRAPLVIGADGRNSTVAREVGTETPRLQSANGRGSYFAYWKDAKPEWRSTAAQWRQGAELVTAFPCDDGQMLVMAMPPLSRAADFEGDLQGEYERTVRAVPELADRLDGATLESKVRHTVSTPSYFRRSSGPGWVLVGDAGHFKDPVTAQGIRDALRYARLLGEMAAPLLDYPRRTDRMLRLWERVRDRDCMETYQWTNRLSRGEAVSPIEAEVYRAGATDPELANRLLDVFARTIKLTDAIGYGQAASLVRSAIRREGASKREAWRAARREVRDGVAEGWERRRYRVVAGR